MPVDFGLVVIVMAMHCWRPRWQN